MAANGYDIDYAALGLAHDRYEAFKSVFLRLDRAQSGAITTKQLDALCFELGEQLDPEELRVATASLENASTGLIHFGTFLKWWISA